jgi:hypothetical protein
VRNQDCQTGQGNHPDQRAVPGPQPENESREGGKEQGEPERAQGFGEPRQEEMRPDVLVGQVLSD